MINNEELYSQRLARYTTAMRNEQPDRVPIRPFVAEFTGTHAGYTCQELAHDYENAFAAVRQCAADYEWDAVVPNMLATWTGMTQAMGLRYYMTPGIHLPSDVGHQYLEPSPEKAWMKPDEYDALIEDPTGYLYNVWFPRVAKPLSPIDDAVTFDHNLALIKGAMAMMQFFQAWGVQEQRLRDECGMPSAIAGMLRAPMDFIADKLRGYLGLVDDLHKRPERVLAACEALMPFLTHFALATADPNKIVPIGFWMHRGCVPFINFDHFDNIFWPTLKPIVQELWANGHQTLFYAEGNWDHHLESFAELPERSIVYHVDQGDIHKIYLVLAHVPDSDESVPRHNGPEITTQLLRLAYNWLRGGAYDNSFPPQSGGFFCIEDEAFDSRTTDGIFGSYTREEGHICGKYHKMQFAEGYDPSWWFNRLGHRSRAFDTPYGRCGMMICNDRWNDRLARIPVLDGARFLLIPAMRSRSVTQDEAVLSRGKENDVPVVEANVGVTLIVNGGKISAVDRQEEGLTLGAITIPPPIARQPEKRDRVEREFLQWREQEM